ncbi:putative RNA-binding protein Luc7-like 2 [Trichinella patagoniensis]|uniref:Putative RNA-binding protein Luc7-like 2 n=1 Tax=Trichinella patagoniensis TaxID=990121 RepID=A0A0V1AB94_9BILA|nr:putative RNA-binding protein Luc7-like 2 [Trichinella patagoniensis]KRZ85676.1 putative RNA-binding protein Luc7-like 2 [Trichinella sp. T8]
MTASEQMRKMLDELMGTSRDGDGGKNTLPFTDTRVCRSYLLNCCPHEVLANTRMDMGMCSRVHDPALRADYEKASTERDYFYDVDALDHLERFFRDCDRRMEGAKKRLAETQEELTEDLAEKGNKVLEFNEQIGITLAEAEKLGEEGKVEESLKLMEKVEELRKLKQEADSVFRSSMPPSSYQQQKLRVCEVCSAYLGIHDNDRRLADHFGGKLHMGFVFLREKYAALQKMVKDRRAERCNSDRRNNDRSYHDYRSSSNYTSRDRDSRRSRSRSRDHRSIDGRSSYVATLCIFKSDFTTVSRRESVYLPSLYQRMIGDRYFLNVPLQNDYSGTRDRGSRFYDESRSSSHRSRCSRSRSNDRNRGSRRSNEERSRSRDYKSRKHE